MSRVKSRLSAEVPCKTPALTNLRKQMSITQRFDNAFYRSGPTHARINGHGDEREHEELYENDSLQGARPVKTAFSAEEEDRQQEDQEDEDQVEEDQAEEDAMDPGSRPPADNLDNLNEMDIPISEEQEIEQKLEETNHEWHVMYNELKKEIETRHETLENEILKLSASVAAISDSQLKAMTKVVDELEERGINVPNTQKQVQDTQQVVMQEIEDLQETEHSLPTLHDHESNITHVRNLQHVISIEIHEEACNAADMFYVLTKIQQFAHIILEHKADYSSVFQGVQQYVNENIKNALHIVIDHWTSHGQVLDNEYKELMNLSVFVMHNMYMLSTGNWAPKFALKPTRVNLPFNLYQTKLKQIHARLKMLSSNTSTCKKIPLNSSKKTKK